MLANSWCKQKCLPASRFTLAMRVGQREDELSFQTVICSVHVKAFTMCPSTSIVHVYPNTGSHLFLVLHFILLLCLIS